MTLFSFGFHPREMLSFSLQRYLFALESLRSMFSLTCKFSQELEDASAYEVFQAYYISPTDSKVEKRHLVVWGSTMDYKMYV